MIEVIVTRIAEVVDHPESTGLTINTIKTKNGEFKVISSRLDDGSPRYEAGNLIFYVPETCIVPDYILKEGYWDTEKNKGILAGSKGNRVKGRKIAGIFSEGLIFPVTCVDAGEEIGFQNIVHNPVIDCDLFVEDGDEISGFLQITEWVQ